MLDFLADFPLAIKEAFDHAINFARDVGNQSNQGNCRGSRGSISADAESTSSMMIRAQKIGNATLFVHRPLVVLVLSPLSFAF